MKQIELFNKIFDIDVENVWEETLEFINQHNLYLSNLNFADRDISIYNDSIHNYGEIVRVWLEYLTDNTTIEVGDVWFDFALTTLNIDFYSGGNNKEEFEQFIKTVESHGFTIKHNVGDNSFDPYEDEDDVECVPIYDVNGNYLGKVDKENIK